jgi:peptidoglycan hydrolase-like protein with peptidoglycan-binding domain
MPVVFTNPQFPNQVGSNPLSQPFSVELNFGQMLREVCQWNPNVDSEIAGRFINERYRAIITRRTWHGLKVWGTVTVPNVVNGGTSSAVFGSPIVQGIGTTWTPALIGLQFRQSFTFPYQTIVAVNPFTQQLTLATPFPGPTFTGGYQITEAIITLGANVNRLMWAVNQQQGWPMDVRTPIETINAWDVWRQSLGWSTNMAQRPVTPDGTCQYEVWPTPYAQQAFPFEAYTQPPEMVKDSDSPVSWIRSDIIVSGAVADALRWRPKQNTYYDVQSALAVARDKLTEWNTEITAAEFRDNDLAQQDVTWDYGNENGPFGYGNGSTFAQGHDM